VWKSIYTDYVATYLDFPFIEDTLKDHFQDVLQELKLAILMRKGLIK
jgi:hypothetical protein